MSEEYNDSSSFNIDDLDVKDQFVENKIAFINKFKKASNTANSTIDDNSSMV
jgi:hypothetical protein